MSLSLSSPTSSPIGATPLPAIGAAPKIAGVAIAPASGVVGAGRTVTIQLTPSAAVAVDTAAGTPALALNDGGVATYDAAASTATSLVFDATVAAGQNAAALQPTGIALRGGGIADLLGDPIDLSAPLPQAAGTLAVDTAAPAVTVALANDTGVSATDGITGDATLRGAGDPNAVVTLTENGAAIGAANADATGAWSFDAGALADGRHEIGCAETDAAGNTGRGVITFVLARAAAPVPSVSLNVAPAAAAAPIGLSVSADGAAATAAGASVTIDRLPGNGAVSLADGTVVEAGQVLTADQFSQLQFAPAAGAVGAVSGLAYSVADAAGNVARGNASLSVSAPVATPSTVIALPGASGSGGSASGSSGTGTGTNSSLLKLISNVATPTLSGTARAGATISVTLNGKPLDSVTADAATGGYSKTVAAPLPTGLQQLAATGEGASDTLDLYVVPAPVQGVSSTGAGSATIANLLSQGYGLQFMPGTEALSVVDGTLSIGQDTGVAALQRLYAGLLGRGSDAAGIGFWNARLTGGANLATVADDILASAEYAAHAGGTPTDAQYVQGLYAGLTGRGCTNDELGYWTGALGQGATRGAVASEIAGSAEAKASLSASTAQVWAPDADGVLLQGVYETGLGREVDSGAGLAFWRGQLTQGLAPAALAQQVAGSAEFQALHAGQDAASFVQSLYSCGLGRAADAAEQQFWTGALQSGAITQGGALLGVAGSAEAAARWTHAL